MYQTYQVINLLMATQNPEITDRKMAHANNHLQTQHMHQTCDKTILLTHLITMLSQFTVTILLNLLYRVVFHLSLPIFLILLHKVAILQHLLYRVVFHLSLPIFLILLHKVAILQHLLYRVVFHFSLPILLKIKMETYPKVRVIHKVLCMGLRIKQVSKIT